MSISLTSPISFCGHLSAFQRKGSGDFGLRAPHVAHFYILTPKRGLQMARSFSDCQSS